MKISKSFKYRLKLKPLQEKTLLQWCGCSRYIYNHFLDQRINTYKTSKTYLGYFSQSAQLPSLKKDLIWLNEPSAQSLQQTLRDLDQTFKNFFRGIKKGDKSVGFPRFKKKGEHDSLKFPSPKCIKIHGEGRRMFVTLPKLGKLQFVKSREIEGRIRYATIKKHAQHWYISFNCEIDYIAVINKGTKIGIDRGIVHTVMTSEQKAYDLPKENILYWEKRIKHTQQKLAKKKMGSSNYRKQKESIARIYNKITNIRKDFLHKTSTELAKNHSYIVLEVLTKDMSKSAKGTVENPGKNVKQKARLNRAILRQGWHTFQTMLEYKSQWYGSYVEYVKASYTSQRCRKCGHTAKANRVTQATFKCKSCGHKENADINAAINILTDGLSGRACGVAA